MRKFLSMGLVLALVAASAPAVLLAAPPQGGPESASLTGAARSTSGQLLSNASVQIRNYGFGEVIAETTSGLSGEFSFVGLEPGQYIVEVVEAGKVMGMTSPITLAAGTALTVEVTVLSSALASSAGAGFSLLGLGPSVSTAVLGAAGAAAVTAVVSTSPEASPSR